MARSKVHVQNRYFITIVYTLGGPIARSKLRSLAVPGPLFAGAIFTNAASESIYVKKKI